MPDIYRDVGENMTIINDAEIRIMKPDETQSALDLAWKVFSEYESPDYTEEGTEEFRKCLNDERYLNGIKYYGAYIGNELAGIIGIRNDTCHICFFFVDGRYHRKGIGTRLFRRVKEDYSGRTITLNSSPYGLPFYRALGFTSADDEQTVNGIRFTPMIMPGSESEYRIVKLAERRDMKEKAAEWFASKWSIPKETYLSSMEESFSCTVPSWYVCLDGDKIIAGLGVIANDFHERRDLTPNICAVYTESFYRRRGIAGKMLNYACEDMAGQGISTLYLLTDHVGFYERYGWKFLCMVQGDGDDMQSRMYVHYQNEN